MKKLIVLSLLAAIAFCYPNNLNAEVMLRNCSNEMIAETVVMRAQCPPADDHSEEAAETVDRLGAKLIATVNGSNYCSKLREFDTMMWLNEHGAPQDQLC